MASMVQDAVRAATIPVAAAKTVGEGMFSYTRGALARRATPQDLASDFTEWLRVVTVREKPEWTHPHQVVREWPVARLLDYSAPPKRGRATVEATQDVVATLVLPPQAGHASTVVDYAEGQSQMMTLRAAGLTKLYCLEWLGATRETTDTTIEDYLQLVAESVEIAGGRVNLIGDCQGGWLATIYAALHPEQVNTLTVAGAPIDCHAGSTIVQRLSRGMAPQLQERMYERLVQIEGGVHRGRSQLAFFKVLEPLAELERAMGLLATIDDPAAVERYSRFTDWFEYTQDVPAAFYLWTVTHLFIRNELINGEMTIEDTEVDLARIECPVFLITGTRDHITPAEQVWALADRISTPADQIVRESVDSGHLGLFMGRESLDDHWLPLMQQVSALSRPEGDRSTA